MSNCNICHNECEAYISAGLLEYNCLNCPKYKTEWFYPGTDEANNRNIHRLFSNNKLEIEKNRHNIRGFLKEKELKGEIFTITVDNFDSLIQLQSLVFKEKLEKLMRFLCRKISHGDRFYFLDSFKSSVTQEKSVKLEVLNSNEQPNTVENDLVGVVWGMSMREVYDLIASLVKIGYIEEDFRGNYFITDKGFSSIEDVSETDKGLAGVLVNNNTGNITVVCGDGNNIAQSLTSSIEKNNQISLKQNIKKFGIDDIDADKLIEAINFDPVQTDPKKFGAKVSEWMGKMVTKAAKGGLNVGTEIAARVLTQMISQYYGLS
jgi:predicted transcriptional regulator